eukprot:2903713-Amphidinium_carterae.2
MRTSGQQTSSKGHPPSPRTQTLAMGAILRVAGATSRETDDLDLKVFLDADVHGPCVSVASIPVDSPAVPIISGLEDEVPRYHTGLKRPRCTRLRHDASYLAYPDALKPRSEATVLQLVRRQIIL